MSASTFQTLSPTPASHQTLGRRILRMSAVWAALGAVVGLRGGLAFGVMRVQVPLVLVANFGLVVGAIAGATLRAYLRLLSLPVVLLGRLLLRDRRLSALALRHDGRVEHQPFMPAIH